MKSKAVFLVLALAASGAAGAEVYKWLDAKGRPQYSNRPPPGVEATRLDIRATPKEAEQKNGQSQRQKNSQSQRRHAEVRRLERRVASEQVKVHKIQARNYDPAKCAAVKRQAEWMKRQDPLMYRSSPDYMLLGQKISLYCNP